MDFFRTQAEDSTKVWIEFAAKGWVIAELPGLQADQ